MKHAHKVGQIKINYSDIELGIVPGSFPLNAI